MILILNFEVCKVVITLFDLRHKFDFPKERISLKRVKLKILSQVYLSLIVI